MLAVPHPRHFCEQYLLKYKLSLAAAAIYVVVGSGGQRQGNVQTIQPIIKASAAYNTVFASEYNIIFAVHFCFGSYL